ncbi:unnamed protein product, partial [Sphenostylis stenocarpa]
NHGVALFAKVIENQALVLQNISLIEKAKIIKISISAIEQKVALAKVELKVTKEEMINAEIRFTKLQRLYDK